MNLRPLLLLALAACLEREPSRAPRGAVVELEPTYETASAATVEIQETPGGVAIEVERGDLGQDPLVMRIAEDCPTAAASPGGYSGARPPGQAPPTIAPQIGPQGADSGSTQAGTKGERSASTPSTADETGQASERMRPTTATPKERMVQLTPTADGFEAPGLTVETILGRALVIETPSGSICGEAHPPAVPAG